MKKSNQKRKKSRKIPTLFCRNLTSYFVLGFGSYSRIDSWFDFYSDFGSDSCFGFDFAYFLSLCVLRYARKDSLRKMQPTYSQGKRKSVLDLLVDLCKQRTEKACEDKAQTKIISPEKFQKAEPLSAGDDLHIIVNKGEKAAEKAPNKDFDQFAVILF